MADNVLDLLIIGGGIVGAGIARDAAMRGLSVAVVEQNDFASGTSSRSSRLLHGGLRYLAQGRIGLVYEASREKKIIWQIAPHLAEPLPFIFPAYRHDREWVLWQLKVGVKIYDLLCGGKNLGQSKWLNYLETLQRVPALNANGLTGAVRYYDGFTNDARLVLDTLRSAAKHQAILLNYCRFSDADRDATRKDLWECEVTDTLTANSYRVRTRAVINATGPWADGLPHSQVKLRLAKGIHLVVERARVPVPDTVVMTEGKRILFAIPWGERVILGTTDTDYDGPPEQVTAGPADIRYILKVANHFFPRARLAPSDVVSSWAGLRPLIADPGGAPSDISRSHEIRTPKPGWWDVAGGKLTTYRLMAEQTVDQIGNWLRKSQALSRPMAPSRTASEPLLPRSETEGISGILPPAFSPEIVRHFCVNEWAVHLDDVMLRRSGWHYYFADATKRAHEIADWMADIFDWPESVLTEEIARYHRVAGCQTETETSSSSKTLPPHVPETHPVV